MRWRTCGGQSHGSAHARAFVPESRVPAQHALTPVGPHTKTCAATRWYRTTPTSPRQRVVAIVYDGSSMAIPRFRISCGIAHGSTCMMPHDDVPTLWSHQRSNGLANSGRRFCDARVSTESCLRVFPKVDEPRQWSCFRPCARGFTVEYCCGGSCTFVLSCWYRARVDQPWRSHTVYASNSTFFWHSDQTGGQRQPGFMVFTSTSAT